MAKKYDYSVLISEKQYLKVKLRASRLKGTKIKEIYYKENELLFKTESGTTPGVYWYQRIKIDSLAGLKINRNTKNLDHIIRTSGLRVHCNCLAKGTLIRCESGVKPIEDLMIYDNIESSEGYNSCFDIVSSLKFFTIQLTLSDGRVLVTTKNHLFKSNGEWIKAKDLKYGQVLDGYLSRKTVIGLKNLYGFRWMYDVVMFNDPHDYYANGVLTHNCPAFLYWGFKFISWHRGYGLEKETRRPVVRNPQQRGYVCKHLYECLQVYPFISTKLAKMFKFNAEKEEKKQVRLNRNNKESDED